MYKRRKISSKKTISGSGDQTSAIPREWLQIHNDNCILVEFPNEDNKIQTAYINWLSKTDQKNIQNIIKESTLIQINWPDQDIAAATVMRKKICNAKFCQYPIRVIATGKWTEMREKEKRILEKDVLETTKNNRSKHSRKILESDDENDLCKMKDNKKIKKKTKVSNIIKPICVTKSVKNPIDYDKSSDESSTSDEFEIFKLQEEKNEQINLNEKDETLEKLKRELEEERRKNTLLMQKPEEQNEKVIDKAETEQNDDSDASVGSERELLSQRSPSLLQRRKYENNLMKHNNYEKSKSPSSIQKQGNHFLGLENESNIFPSTSQMDSPDKSNLNERVVHVTPNKN